MTPPGRWVIVARDFQTEVDAGAFRLPRAPDALLRVRQTNHQRGRERWCVEVWRPVDAAARRLGKKRAASLTPERKTEIARAAGVARWAKRDAAKRDAEDFSRHAEAKDAESERFSAAHEKLVQGIAQEITKAAKGTP